MALIVNRAAKQEFWAGWPTTHRDVFIKSKAYDDLYKAVGHHLASGIAGRSFLIAGHRGAGKTALVRAVVDDLRREIFKGAETGLPPKMRPLLISLHGPSLLGADAAAQDSGLGSAPQLEEQGDAKAEQAEEPRVSVEVKVDAKAAESAKTAEGGRSTDPIQNALVQITISLYRAVASEFAQAAICATQEATTIRAAQGLPPGELPELAARLRLELDSMPDVAMLRDIWARIDQPLDLTEERPPLASLVDLDLRAPASSPAGQGRLACGLLWPSRLSKKETDAGFREIVALSTAAQAFQVCIGKVTASAKRSGASSRDAKLEFKASAGLRDVTNKLFALAAGVGVAVGIGSTTGSASAGAGFGLLGALVTATSLGWSAVRTTKDDRAIDYSFLPDLSTLSLDRDLPVVIERVRAVGLAPIFVVDEIDKIDEPDEPLRKLMKRLKQLTADYGFFCFLTDRDYYDRVEKCLAASVFPVEHTYFSTRILIAYSPRNFTDYMRTAISFAEPAQVTAASPEAVAALMLGRALMHRSQLNATELVRAIAAVTDLNETVIEPETRIRSLETYRLRVILQLAIEHAMRRPPISARLAANARFVQIAADALYMISREWNDEKLSVKVTQNAIKSHMDHRMARSGHADLLSGGDLVAFAEAVQLVADLMSDFERLRKLLEPELDEIDRPLLAVFEPPLTPLLRKVNPRDYRFCWDPYGLLREQPTQERVDERVGDVAGFVALLQELDVTIDQIVAAGLLPATVTHDAIRQTVARVRMREEGTTDRSTDDERVARFHALLVERGPILKLGLALVRYVRSGAQCTGAAALAAMQRYLPLEEWVALNGEDLWRALTRSLPSAASLPYPDLSPASDPNIDEWREQILGLTTQLPETVDVGQLWASWFPRVDAHFRGEPKDLVVTWRDILFAARDELPGNLFHRDLSTLEIIDWSRLVLVGALFQSAPAWTIPAGLVALGFDRGRLDTIGSALKGDPNATSRGATEAIAFIDSVLDRTPDNAPGVLDIVSRPESEAGKRAAGDPPILRVRADDIREYSAALEWLQRCALFVGRVDDGLEA